MSFGEQLKTLSHHAYCFIGGSSVVEELILILEKEHGIKSRGNSDFFNRKYEVFTIDDARELKSNHGIKPVSESVKRIFIISVNGITTEAQNALLKLLEEPADYAHFFIIIPSPHLLLPTVKSRLRFIEVGKQAASAAESESLEEAKKFLKMSTAKKLDFIKLLTDDIKKEKRNKQNAINFLNAIQEIVYKEKGVKNGRAELEAIETARKYMNDTAPSIKMLLEYVAMNL